MKKSLLSLTIAMIAGVSFAQTSADPAEVDATVAAIKSAHPDLRALCQQGADGIRKAATSAVTGLASAGKVKSPPAAVGGEAGQRIGRECRGG